MIGLIERIPTGPYQRNGAPHTCADTVPSLWFESIQSAKKLSDIGWYFFDECEVLHGPYVSSGEACKALDKYADELLGNSNRTINANKE